MRDAQTGRTLRALRHRRRWRQSDLSARAGVARSVISSLEAGDLGRHTLQALRQAVAACGGVVQLELRVPGGDLSRLLDADHARLQAHWADRLRHRGWLVDVEVTFNHYGERGSIDILAWHPAERLLVVAEVKTVIVDAQALLTTIDRKSRVASVLVRQRGWRPVAVVPALLVLEGSTARRRIASTRRSSLPSASSAEMFTPGSGVHPSLCRRRQGRSASRSCPMPVLATVDAPAGSACGSRAIVHAREQAFPEPMKVRDVPNDARTGV